MNHTTTDPALPESAPYADTRQRIALARRRLDNLFSLISVGVLLLMPVLFVVAHIAADGAVWNFATGEKFITMFNVMSSFSRPCGPRGFTNMESVVPKC
jgi:multisubunit Na+/H+ antiporter MnhB subunit